MGQFDHIVSHFDGNNNDKDDIAALPVAALLTNAASFEDKSTFFYSNNLGEPNSHNDRLEVMRESAAFAEKLGIQTYDYQANTDAATAALVDILDSGQKVLAIEGGPMEAIYRALSQTSVENRQNVTLISHSSWNENRDVASRPGVDDVHTWKDIKNDFPEVETIDISDQNNGHNNDKGFNNANWTWLDETTDPLLQEARALMENAGNKVNDPSDAGMHFYALTGNQKGVPQDVKALFEQNPPSLEMSSIPTPTPTSEPGDSLFLAENGQLVLEAESAELTGDWQLVTVQGETSVLWDTNKSSYGKVPVGQTLTYQFETDEAGSYRLALHSGRIKDVMNSSDRYNGAGKERTDTGNDVYVSIVNAETDAVVQKPTKLFTGLGHSDRELKWGFTFDANHKQSRSTVPLEADTQYRLEITGRSDGYALDRITLSNSQVLKNADIPESPVKGSSDSITGLSGQLAGASANDGLMAQRVEPSSTSGVADVSLEETVLPLADATANETNPIAPSILGLSNPNNGQSESDPFGDGLSVGTEPVWEVTPVNDLVVI